jgi:IS4 transposase
MEQYVTTQFESVSSPVGRNAPGFGEVTHDLRITGRIEFEQCRVVRDHRVDEYEGKVGVTVVVGRFGIDRENQSSAALRRCLGAGSVLKN